MQRVSYKVIPMHKLRPGSELHTPRGAQRTTLDSPALEVMTDLQHVAAATIGPDATINRATEVMIARGVRLLFVIDVGVGLVGLITARDTMGERPINWIRERGGKHGDICVRDLMVPAANIDVLNWANVTTAKIGHVVATLSAHCRQHALVVDIDPLSGEEMIRGIFSATEIGRRLDMPLHPVEAARTFAEIRAELAH